MSDSPYDRGFSAAMVGENMEDNPYPQGSEDADEWEAGWMAAMGQNDSQGGYY